LRIVNPVGDTVVVAELELGDVAVQVLLAAVLIDALHAALEDGEVAFDRVRVDGLVVAVHVLACAVMNEIMTREVSGKLGVLRRLIRHDVRLLGDVLTQDRQERGLLEIVHHDGFGAAGGAVHEGQNLVLMVVATALLGMLRLDAAVVPEITTPSA